MKLLGLMLLVAPHIIGALDWWRTTARCRLPCSPHALVVQAVTWIALGVACWFWRFQVLRATTAVPNEKRGMQPA